MSKGLEKRKRYKEKKELQEESYEDEVPEKEHVESEKGTRKSPGFDVQLLEEELLEEISKEIGEIHLNLPKRREETRAVEINPIITEKPVVKFKEVEILTALPRSITYSPPCCFSVEIPPKEEIELKDVKLATDLPKLNSREDAGALDCFLLDGGEFELDINEKVQENISTSLEGFDLSPLSKQGGLFEKVLGIEIEEKEREEWSHLLPRSLSHFLNRPIVVYLQQKEDREDEYPSIVAYGLKELLLEVLRRGGEVTFRGAAEGEDVDGIDLDALKDFKIPGKLEIVDFRSAPHLVAEFCEEVHGRLRKMYLEGFGILMIIGKEIREIEDKLKIKGVLKYKAVPRSGSNKWRIFAMLGIEEETLFKALIRRDREFRKILLRYSVFVRRQTRGGEGVDRWQYPWKVLTFYLLLKEKVWGGAEGVLTAERAREIFEEILGGKIRIEEPLEELEWVIPDIILEEDGKKIFVEVESLIGTEEPMKKIDETLEKYEGKIKEGAEIWIIVRPESALIHYEELKFREKLWKEAKNMEVYFKVPVLFSERNKGWKLLDLKEYHDVVESLRGAK